MTFTMLSCYACFFRGIHRHVVLLCRFRGIHRHVVLLCRFRGIHRHVVLFSDAAVHRGSVAGQARLLSFLLWCNPMPGIFLALSHRVLPFRARGQVLQQVSWDIQLFVTVTFALKKFNKWHVIGSPNFISIFGFRLDYCGIALLTMGSFVPWLYYSFYCRIEPKITYLALILVLGKSYHLHDAYTCP